MKIFFTLFFGVSTVLLCAQKHDYVWMHGYYDYINFKIDFNENPPEIYVVDGFYDIKSTMLLMSDSSGIPTFFSNGCSIWNADFLPVKNGDSLLFNDYFCSQFSRMNLPQAVFSLPDFRPNCYVAFSGSYNKPLSPQPCQNNSFYMHKIDMTLNQDSGEVVIKDEKLLEGCFQIACANRHANGRDWWIVLGDNQIGRYYRWLFTPAGLQGPWEQEMSNPTLDGYWFCGWAEFSPNGERFMVNGCRSGVVVYDFDRCTGLLSNPVFINHSTLYNQCAIFSPNSQILYTVDKAMCELLQYDLAAPDVAASKQSLAVWDGVLDSFGIPTTFSYMQQGPDGKVYIWAGGSVFMHVINFPNRLALDCGLQQRVIQLPTLSDNPNLYYPNYRLGPKDNSTCDTLGINNLPSALFRYDLEDTLSPLQVTFTDVSSYLPTAWHWDFGDGAMSQDTNSVHIYAMPGTYQVCLIVSNQYAADTLCQQVQVGTVGIHELPALPYVTVSPNPFSNEIKVQLPARVGVNPQFVLYDLLGLEIKSVVLDDFETVLSLAGCPSGLYVWQLRWEGVATQSGRVVKM
jgi:hypothetical protein